MRYQSMTENIPGTIKWSLKSPHTQTSRDNKMVPKVPHAQTSRDNKMVPKVPHTQTSRDNKMVSKVPHTLKPAGTKNEV